jgi:uncharacterized protein
MDMQLSLLKLKNSEDYNIVVGMSHFIKTVEDVHELVVNTVPGAKFGLAFCEASGPRKIRKTGTDSTLIKEAVRMATLIGAGHSFVLVLKDSFPINILPRLKQVPEIVTLFCATANPVQVIVAESEQGRGIMGVIDGGTPSGVENRADVKERRAFLRSIGYKL